MNRVRSILATLGAVGLLAAMECAAVPTLPRAWVASFGVDVASCGTVDAPCRTFQYVHDNIVLSGGSVYVQDAANYGQVVISKSLSLINDGSGTATIFATSGNAIAVASGAANVLVRGLTLDGAGSGTNGVSYTASGGLTVDNCIIRGFVSNGMSVVPGGGGVVSVVDTLITGNVAAGIYTFGSSAGSLTLSVSRSKIVGNGFASNGYGIRLTGGAAAYQYSTIDSTIIGQNGTGLSVEANGSNEVSGALFDSKVLGNAKSINVAGGGLVRLGRTSVQSAFGANITNGGSIISYGNNEIVDGVTGTAIDTTALR
jgi:hypothetical protein